MSGLADDRRRTPAAEVPAAPPGRPPWLRLLVAIAAAMAPAALMAADGSRTSVTVRVFQAAGLSEAFEATALAEAERVLRSAVVDVRWRRCGGGEEPSSECQQPLQDTELSLRMLRADRPSNPSIHVSGVSVGTNSPPSGPISAHQRAVGLSTGGNRGVRLPAALGEALVDVDGGTGVLATVYVERVERLATDAEVDPALLIGRVAAHELGHLLMNSPLHARYGLMRARWTVDEIRRNRASDWAFTVTEARAVRERSVTTDVGWRR